MQGYKPTEWKVRGRKDLLRGTPTPTHPQLPRDHQPSKSPEQGMAHPVQALSEPIKVEKTKDLCYLVSTSLAVG